MVTQLHVWVHIWDHHQAVKYQLQKKSKHNTRYASVYLVCIFAFLKVFIWQPDGDPKCAPRHVTASQYINSCVGRKVYTPNWMATVKLT